MAKYIKQEFKSIRGEGEASAYYRMETSRRVTMAEFVKEISIPGYGINEATAVQVLSQAATSLARLMAHGCAVTIDGIGTFKATVGVCDGKEQDAFVENEPQRNAQSIKVNGVHYKADKRLVRDINVQCTRVASRTVSSTRPIRWRSASAVPLPTLKSGAICAPATMPN